MKHLIKFLLISLCGVFLIGTVNADTDICKIKLKATGEYLKIDSTTYALSWVAAQTDASDFELIPVSHEGMGSKWYAIKDATASSNRYVSYSNNPQSPYLLVETTTELADKWTAPASYAPYNTWLTPLKGTGTGALLIFERPASPAPVTDVMDASSCPVTTADE